MDSPVELPEDMVRKILTKLPVSTMVRLSCVCKLWRDLVIKIKNPDLFGERHLENPNNFCNDIQPTLVFFRRELDNAPNITEDSLITHTMKHVLSPPGENDPFLEVQAACNGIVCLAHNFFTDVVHLYNPITRKLLKLPPSLFREQAKKSCIQFLGLGFDASCNDYKVIRIITHVSCFDQEIYRLSTGCWSELELDYDHIVYKDDGDGVFCNGFFHWPIKRRTIRGRNEEYMILTFNFQTEKLGDMQYPPDLLLTNYRWWISGLTEMDDSLAVYCHYDTQFRVWVMREYGKKESWTLKFFVVLSVDIKRVVSVRVHNMSLVVLASYCLLDSGRRVVGWLTEGGEGNTLFEGRLGLNDCSWAVFRPSLVSLLQ